MANAASVDANQHFTGLRLGNRTIFDREVVGLSDNERFQDFSVRRLCDEASGGKTFIG
jgi:hypothetical protein